MNTLAQQLSAVFPHLPLQSDFPLAAQTYFKVGGPAEVYLELAEREEIIEFIRYCRQEKIPLTILGGASNVIISDRGIAGAVLKLTNEESGVTGQEGERTFFRAGAGLKTALLVRQTVDAGLTGLEFFLGVPGNVGGAVYNNAHYLEHLLSEHISRVEVIDETGEPIWLEKEFCEFSYDHSRFQKTKEVILQAEFLLPSGTAEMSHELIRRATLYRAQTQPLGLPSSGCIFQNAPNTPDLEKRFPQFAGKKYVPGGFLIDQAGLKGSREGDIEVSEKHAAFFINKGHGTAEDIQKLITRVKTTVREQFGAELQEEVFWLGRV